MFVVDLFIAFIYQPFLNLLVFIYWLLGLGTQGQPDMGVAVIILSVIIRVILLPMSLTGSRSEPKKREIADKVRQLHELYASDPVKFKQEKKKIFKKSTPVVVGEIISLVVQVVTALMLWKIFASGLSGQDLHLLYDFMPRVEMPFNLNFLGRYDLTHTSLTLNLLQSVLIFILETVSLYTSPYPTSRHEVIRLQLILPVVSFIIFMGLPAGKKLFVITALCFSIVLTIVKAVRRRFLEYQDEVAAREAAENLPSDERVVVEVK
ncbi:MAG TPA: YidC/Oxa1 family membrane protein insertase [Patescibacteria group bacterium]